MTPQEKVRTVVGTSVSPASPPQLAPGLVPSVTYEGGDQVNTYLSEGSVRGAAGESLPLERLGIPSIIYADGPAGVRIDPVQDSTDLRDWCTAFPTASLLSSTWDPSLVEQIGDAIGQEMREYGVDVLLAPAMNIQRNPLTGRNFEYFSEDPLLSGRIAAAYVRGVQGNGVAACLKHFAANNQELYRYGIDARVSERALREIYLRGFEIAVRESSPAALMSSYNKVNGIYASENKWLLEDVLRGEWGFDGEVMTDWWATCDPVSQIKAGNDLLMPGCPSQIDSLLSALKYGNLDEAELDRSVARVLGTVKRSPKMSGKPVGRHPDLASHDSLARRIAGEGMVLLRNEESALPIAPQSKLALFGVYSYDTQVGGSGSGYVNRKFKVNLSEGLEEAGFGVDSTLKVNYTAYIAAEKAKLPGEYFWVIPTAGETAVPLEQIRRAARENDYALLTFGRMAGEGSDRSAGKGDYLLSDLESGLLGTLCREFHALGKKVVVVLNVGSPIELTRWDTLPDAILFAWMPGQQAGNAIADVLSGKVNPSGKLPMTLARSYTDIPSSRNFGVSEGELNKVCYEEELMVGYRYFCTSGVPVEYPFGFGLSYTDFNYGEMEAVGDSLIRLRVKNTGKCAGREAVQIYVRKPGHMAGRPTLELCAFSKTPTLMPGESCTLEFPIEKRYLQCFENGEWLLPEGDWTFFAAASAEDLRRSVTLSF